MCLSIAVHFPQYVLAKGEHLGFEWNVIRNARGFRCGYVRVPAGHPWHGKDYHDLDVNCHGGLTFSEPDLPCGAGDDDAHWVGFDCAHGFDLPDPALAIAPEQAAVQAFLDRILPGMRMSMFDFGAEVRSQEYVEGECRSICEQAALSVAGGRLSVVEEMTNADHR